MIIKTSCPNFEPDNFEILDFYNEKTVFVWQNDQFVYFPLKTLTSSSEVPEVAENLNFKIVKAPSGIRKLKGYKNRVFLITEPRGIYKFVINNKIETFRVLSSTAVDIATEFYKNLTIKDNFLYLQDKQEKYTNELFFLNNYSSNIDTSNSIIDLTNIDQSGFDTSKSRIDISKSKSTIDISNSKSRIDVLQSKNFDISQLSGVSISNSKSNIDISKPIDINSIKIESTEVTSNLKNLITDKDICLIINNYLLYKFIDNKTQLIYTSTYQLTDFVVIKNNNNKINNILLKTVNKKLLILITEDLCFKKIFFNYDINNCVGFTDNNEDIINLVIGGDKIYFVSVKITTGIVNYHSYLNDELKDLKIIDKQIWGLKSAGELAGIPEGFKKMAGNDNEEFELKSGMCSGMSVIVDSICDSSKELKVRNEKLLVEQEKLKRINIYAHKTKLLGVKKIWVERTSCCIFLKATFEGSLPRECWIRVGVSCKDQEFFSMQAVENEKIGVELPLPVDYFDSTADINLDLVTLVEEDKPWFIVKDCEKKATAKEKEHVRSLMEKKKNFLNTKLGVVRASIGPEEDFKKICNVKKSLRKEITDF